MHNGAGVQTENVSMCVQVNSSTVWSQWESNRFDCGNWIKQALSFWDCGRFLFICLFIVICLFEPINHKLRQKTQLSKIKDKYCYSTKAAHDGNTGSFQGVRSIDSFIEMAVFSTVYFYEPIWLRYWLKGPYLGDCLFGVEFNTHVIKVYSPVRFLNNEWKSFKGAGFHPAWPLRQCSAFCSVLWKQTKDQTYRFHTDWGFG